MIQKTINAYRVTPDEVKKQLNIEPEYKDDDAYINSLIEVATDYVSGLINADIELTTNTLDISLDGCELKLMEAPYVSVDALKIDAQDYSLYKLTAFYSDFLLTDLIPGKLEMTFTTGYQTIPPSLKQAIIIKAADLYDPERSNTVVGVSIQNTGVIDGLVAKYRRRYY